MAAHLPVRFLPSTLAIAIAAFAGSAVEGRAATTQLFLDSQPGDYVGGGQSQTLTPQDGAFTANENGGFVTVSFSGQSLFWFLQFAAPDGEALVAGAYEDAQRASFHSPTHPGLDVFGDGRGCNAVSGRFVIYELVTNSSGNVLRFAADFEQHCEGAPPALFGSIRINSVVSIEPRLAVAGRRLLEGDIGFSDASFTVFLTHPALSAVTATYATADGSAHAGTDYVATMGTITFAPGEVAQTVYVAIPTNLAPQPDRDFSVALSAVSGVLVGAPSASALILDDDGGKSFLYLDSQPFDYIGRGARRTLTILDGTFVGRLSGGHATIVFDGDVFDSWRVEMAAPEGDPLAPGAYENAERWPFQDPAIPGLDVSGGGSGCNTLTGRFVVHEITADASGNLQRFAADFEQHCGGSSAGLFGSIRIHSTVPIVHQSPVTGDFNGDGRTDILWRNGVTGENLVWLMNGMTASPVTIAPVGDTNWTMVGTADFNADGETDILWRHATTGAGVVWFMNDTSISSGAVVPSVADANWKVVATGRFDGDGWPDILWRNQATGDNVVWFMRGAAISGGAVLTRVSDLNWQIAGAGDVNGDGRTDLFWRNAATGQDVVWLMNGTEISDVVLLPALGDTNWTLAAVGDFNDDGGPDLVWRNRVTGDNAVWFLNGTRRSGFVFLPSLADTNWSIRGPK